MRDLPDWLQAKALILSCPGPLRRQAASLVPIGSLALPQVWLGAESQLLAFAAAFPQAAERMVFAALPEMFSTAAHLSGAFARLGRAAPAAEEMLHLRFGPVREVRVLKGVRNAAVLAEAATVSPLAAGYHPFASGTALPAGMEALLAFPGASAQPAALGRPAAVPLRLPERCETADLPAPHTHAPSNGRAPDQAAPPPEPPAAKNRPKTENTSPNRRKRATAPGATPTAPERAAAGSIAPEPGLDLVSLENFRSWDWAARRMPADAGLVAALASTRAVLLPWNMAHFGSILPELLCRILRLAGPAASLPSMILLPYNYLGQTGIIRELIARLREASGEAGAALSRICLGRVTAADGLATLRRLAVTAWVDGTDPEAWWTGLRLQASGFAPLALGGAGFGPGTVLPVRDRVLVAAETRFGPLSFDVHLPAWRDLPALLATIRQPPTAGPESQV